MKDNDRLKRAIAFYFSVALFFTLLPILLSYSLGYKIDYKKFKIYKTGILYLNSTPAGASIYINGKLHTDLTPARIEELKPGSYNIEVKREGFYAWEKELTVRPNMVTKADGIVLFPMTQDLKRIVKYPIYDFVISDNKNRIYYMTGSGIFESNMDGSAVKKISPYSDWPRRIIGRKFSPDGTRLLYFNEYVVHLIYLNVDKSEAVSEDKAIVEQILISEYPIIDLFWYAGSNYIIVVSEKDISVLELLGGGRRNVALVYKFNTRPSNVYYDYSNNSLYFTDEKRELGLKEGNRLYRLDLSQSFFNKMLKFLMKMEAKKGHGEK